MTTNQQPHTDAEAVEIIEDISKDWLLNAPTWRRALLRVIETAKRAISDEGSESEPPEIAQGKGWRILDDEKPIEGDEFTDPYTQEWRPSEAYITGSPQTKNCKPYRRRIKPEWPKWYVRTSGADQWVYIARSESSIYNLTTNSIAEPAEWYWRHGNMNPITEAEALARISPPQPSPTVKRVPIHLWTHRNALTGMSCRVIAQSRPVDDCNVEIHSDGNGGWYVESAE